MSNSDELIITCSCSRLDHAVRFSFFPCGPGNSNDGSFEAYVDVSLDPGRRFWDRLKTSWRYLWRQTCGFGNCCEILVKDRDLQKIRAWLDRAENSASERYH